MLRYSELTPAQKKLFDAMRNGHVLRYESGQYLLAEGNHDWKVRVDTAYTLERRGYIKKCYWDNERTQFCVNVEVV